MLLFSTVASEPIALFLLGVTMSCKRMQDAYAAWCDKQTMMLFVLRQQLFVVRQFDMAAVMTNCNASRIILSNTLAALELIF